MKKNHLITHLFSIILLLSLSSIPALAAEKAVEQKLLIPFKQRPSAPDFTLKDMEGEFYQLSKQKGKVIVLNFWATWCPPCLKEMPSMQRAWDKVKKDNILLWAVNVGETEDDIFAFSAEVEVNFPLLINEDQSVMQRWGVQAMPTTYIIDKKGRVAYYAIGDRQWDNTVILDVLKALNAEK